MSAAHLYDNVDDDGYEYTFDCSPHIVDRPFEFWHTFNLSGRKREVVDATSLPIDATLIYSGTLWVTYCISRQLPMQSLRVSNRLTDDCVEGNVWI